MCISLNGKAIAQVFYSYQKSRTTPIISSNPQPVKITTCIPKKAKLQHSLFLLEREQNFFRPAVVECTEKDIKNKEWLFDLEQKIENIKDKIKELLESIQDLSFVGLIQLQIQMSVYNEELKKATEERDAFMKVIDTDKERCDHYKLKNERNEYAIQQVKKELEDPKIC
ncbi:hypothetical protein RF11_02541 [Thelohanellus kitauei]|uniref:Uncharacterized protein n=1 Tax=Thelohanellus kitauei TaxID=669202 RepID=A0A0C2MIF2_THEKT|nr:hypothetical protein RF11_02541 [Thelohanellus kitauei]